MALRRLRAGMNTSAVAIGATTSNEYEVGSSDGSGDKPLLIKKISFSMCSDARVTWAFIIYNTDDATPHAIMMDNMDYTSYRFKTVGPAGSELYMEKFKTGIVIPAGHECRFIARQDNVNNAAIYGDSVIWVVEDV